MYCDTLLSSRRKLNPSRYQITWKQTDYMSYGTCCCPSPARVRLAVWTRSCLDQSQIILKLLCWNGVCLNSHFQPIRSCINLEQRVSVARTGVPGMTEDQLQVNELVYEWFQDCDKYHALPIHIFLEFSIKMKTPFKGIEPTHAGASNKCLYTWTPLLPI